MEPTSIKAYDILKMATIEGARVLGLDNEIGTLEPGKKADMIFIRTDKLHLCPDNDVCTNIVYSANGSDVDTVMIDGAGYSWTNTKGALQQMPNPSGGYYDSGVGHSGNGFARITFLHS